MTALSPAIEHLFVQTIVSRAVRRHAAAGVTRRKCEILRELAVRTTRARFHFVSRYWGTKYAETIIHRPRVLIELHRREGTLARDGLNVHQSTMAFKEAIWILRVSWSRCLKRARAVAFKNPALDDQRRRWILFVLRWPSLMQQCLDGGVVHVNKDWAVGLDERRLAHDLRRLITRCRGRTPRPGKKLWFQLDTHLYRPFVRAEDRHFRGAWLAITAFERRRRLNVPLAGRTITEFARRRESYQSLPTIHVEVGERIVFHLREQIAITPRTDGIEAGIDKGYTTLLTLSTGDAETAESYGAGADEIISEIAEEAALRQKERQRLFAYERSIRNSQPAKARRIRRRNLRGARTMRAARRDRARLTQQVGLALNELFSRHPEISVLHVESLHFTGSKFSRAMRMRFHRWLKGHLHRSLEFKAQLHGVRLNVVNAAWTSLTCPRCGYPSRNNRKVERFVCGSCGYAGFADAVAATNVLMRGSDRAIARFMRKDRVERILMDRWRSALTGGAWDSNVGADGEPTSSREELPVGSPAFRSQNHSPSPQ